MPNTAPELEEMMSEREVYERYGHLFVDKELREARAAGEIEFFHLRKGIFYTPSQLREYLAKKRVGPCRLSEKPPAPESANSNDFSRSETSGSSRKKADLRIIEPGTAESEKEFAGDALAQTILRKPRDS
jgi:hypothetical protein